MPEAKSYRQSNIHTEDVVQKHVMERLVALQGFEVRRNEEGHFDGKRALDPDMLFAFLKDTQPDVLAQLESSYPGRGKQTLLDELDRNLREHGTLHVLRKGLDIIPNIRVSVCALKPASEINQTLMDRYLKNRLSVMEEVVYSTKASNNNRIDLVLFVNGLPVVTMELKNLNTGSTFKDAEKQYQKDRRPAGEPLLEPGRGALVHMAVDQNFVSMTTTLANGKTQFLPFNRGRDGQAGNPDRADGEWRTAYLYADEPGQTAVFSREVLLEIIGKFLHVDDGRLVFPRFQQLHAVRKIVADAREHGAGRNYLVQHSAGSGKSLTIAWSAHRLATLHNARDEAVFDSVIIVTDRVVLDRQLQDTVTGLGGPRDYVKPIKGTSRELREALEKGAKIVVTTIQKFSTDHLTTLSGLHHRNFAVIVDEAHGSQSGKHADHLAGALSQGQLTGEETVEEMIARFQSARGPSSNVSYLAFTATPRNVTLERFGEEDPVTGEKRPFHLYSMRQAIDEGFIVDVLENYSTYKAYHELEKAIEDDPAFEGRQGARRVAKFVSLHPTNIAQKVAVIVEHFRRHVLPLMDGQAKAMVVTSSREHAYRYFVELNRYIEAEGHGGVRALVAFSGDLEVDGEKVSEPQLNGFGEKELPERFDSDAYQVLIVAEKYQTGFDQPKLCAMYVDRKLNGLQAVQTLSRLNRMHPLKARTFVLDFQNTIEDIRDAFKPWFETTELEERTNPNQVFDLRSRILQSGFVTEEEIEGYAARFFRPKLAARDRLLLEGFVRPAVERFETAEESEQETFRQLLNSYRRFYGFVAQVFPVRDERLEKLYAYVDMLAKMLPGRERPAEVEITSEMIRLVQSAIEESEQGSATPETGDGRALPPISEFGDSGYTEDERRTLSEIIAAFNDRHGTDFSEGPFLRYQRCHEEVLADPDKVEMIRNNSRDVVDRQYKKWFKRAMIQMYKEDKDVQDIMMQDAAVQDQIIGFYLDRAVRQVHSEAARARGEGTG